MKKWLFVVIALIFSGFLFSESYLKDYISEFLNKGSYISIEDNSDAVFYPKHIIAKVECDSDDLKFTYVDTEYDYESESYNIKKYLIKLDENYNIVISKK